jgi:uncharacterized phage-associated protein
MFMRQPVSQLKPFNASLFEDVMGFLCARYDATLTQYEVMKIHIKVDVEHTFKTGQPVIGGPLRAWPFGPVVPSAYGQVKDAIEANKVDGLEVCRNEGRTHWLRFLNKVSEDDFSPLQVEIFDAAFAKVRSMPWKQSQAYFHGDGEPNAIGYAWKLARKRQPTGKPPIDWWDLIEGGEKYDKLDLEHVKLLMAL